MKFDHIIMNPPYCRNLHLKILNEAICYSDDIVNLSPIRWLQDPLAERKRNSDFNKFENIRNRIEGIDVVPMVEATRLFNSAAFSMDLGIYHITKKGGWVSTYKFPVVDKVEVMIESGKVKAIYDFGEKEVSNGWRVRLHFIAPFPSNIPNGVTAVGMKYEICHPYHDWVYKDGYTKDGIFWADNVHHKAGPKSYTKHDKLPYSIKFGSEEEAYNFQAYTKTKFFKYIYSTVKIDQNVPLKFLPFMQDYTHPWTDEMLYEYFNLTPEEIAIIENEI